SFFPHPAPPALHPPPLHDALPIFERRARVVLEVRRLAGGFRGARGPGGAAAYDDGQGQHRASHVRRLAAVRPRRLLRSSEFRLRSEEHTSELQSLTNIVCRLLLEK